MPERQTKPGIKSTVSRDPELKGAEVVPMLMGDLGSQHVDEAKVIVDEDSYFKEYLPSISIDGLEIPLGPDCLPLPKQLTEYILSQPDSPLRELRQLRARIEGASSDDIGAITDRLLSN